MQKSTIAKLLLLATGIVALDRITKNLVVANLYFREIIPVIQNYFNIIYIHNPGGAFGTKLGGNVFYLITSTLAAVAVIVWLFAKKHHTTGLLGIALLIGGYAGNFWDRLQYGIVIDFLDFGIKDSRWPTFNIADSAVTLGIIMLVLQELFFTPKISVVKNEICDETIDNKDLNEVAK